MVFSATFSNISVISWRVVLLVGETGVSGENYRSATSHWQTLSHNVVSSIPRLSRIRTHNVKTYALWRIGVMVLSATFSNISVISWPSVLMVEETRVPGENHQLSQALSRNVVSRFVSWRHHHNVVLPSRQYLISIHLTYETFLWLFTAQTHSCYWFKYGHGCSTSDVKINKFR